MPILDSTRGAQPTEGWQGPPATVDGTPPMVTSPFRRCTGHCCRGFAIMGLSMADFHENKRRIAMGGPWPQHTHGGHPIWGPIIDIDVILEVLEDLPADAPRPRSWRDADRVAEGPFFRCKALDGDRCTIYERRPHFCRSYPNGRPCEWCGCTREP